MLRVFLYGLLFTTVLSLCLAFVYLNDLAVWGVNRWLDDSGLELNGQNMTLDLRNGVVSGDQVTLRYREGDSPPLIKIQALRAQLKVSDFFAAANGESSLKITNGRIRIPRNEGDTSAEEPLHGDFVRFRGWLPAQLNLNNIYITWGDDPLLEQLHVVSAIGGVTDTAYDLKFSTHYGSEDLDLDVSLSPLERSKTGGQQFDVTTVVSSTGNGASAKLGGVISGDSEALNYQWEVKLTLSNLETLLENLVLDYPLAGKITVSAAAAGDLAGLKLDQLVFSIENPKEYSLHGKGDFSYQFGGENHLFVDLSGDLVESSILADLFDESLLQLGSAKVSGKMEGPLENLMLRDFSISTHNDDNLRFSITGDARLKNFGNEDIGESGVLLRASAPSLAQLKPWTGGLDFEVGPWEVSGTIRQRDNKVALEDFALQAGTAESNLLRATGSIANIGKFVSQSTDDVMGIDLQLNLSGAMSLPVFKIIGLDLPELGSPLATARLSGSDQLLKLDQLNFTVSVKDQHTVVGKGGQLEIPLAPEPGLSVLNIPLTVEMASTSSLDLIWGDEVVDLGSLKGSLSVRKEKDQYTIRELNYSILDGASVLAKGKGHISSLAPVDDIHIVSDITALPLREVLKQLSEEPEKDHDPGTLKGSLTIDIQGDELSLSDVDLSNSGSDTLQFTVSGNAHSQPNQRQLDLRGTANLRKMGLLNDWVGLPIKSFSSQFHLKGDEKRIELDSNNKLGDSKLRIVLTLPVDGRQLLSIGGRVESTQLDLRDLGLIGRDEAKEQPVKKKKESQRLAELQKSRSNLLPIDALPLLPIDLQIKIDQILGHEVDSQGFRTRFTARSGLYQLEDFRLRYPQGSLRASAGLDNRGQQPQWNLKVEGTDYRLEKMLAELSISSSFTANINSLVTLNASGNTMEKIIASSNGEVALALEDLTLKGRAYDVLASDTLAWLYSGAALDKETKFDCVMGQFAVTEGVASSKDLFVESKRMIARGSGKFDFNDMTMKVGIIPRSKNKALSVPGRVTFKGPMEDPDISTPALAQATDATAQVLFLAPAITLRIFGAMTNLVDKDDPSPCEPGQDAAAAS